VQHQRPTEARRYYDQRFWNEIPAVDAHLNRKATGDPGRDWIDQTLELLGGPAERALILNCGNGCQERRLLDRGVIRSAVGIDISAELLDEARTAGDGLPVEYHEMDVNTAEFPAAFDVVINVGAAHHIAWIDHVFRRLCELLPADGWFISNDYVGPHRNQYPWEQWSAAWALNETLPEAMRKELIYPHLPTMLAVDPTEAIHSELLIDTFERYFTTEYSAGLGGALAYLLLTHNDKVIDAADEWAAEIQALLEADDRSEFPPMFAFWAGHPNKASLEDPRAAGWTTDETRREEAAADAAGEYYPRTLLQTLMIELSEREVAIDHAHAWARDLNGKIDQLDGDLRNVRGERDNMLASRSWRWTAPLRRR